MIKTHDVKHLNVSIKELAPIITEQLAAGKSVTFAPKGTSMLPLLREGKDSVTLSAIKSPPKKYDIVFYQRQNGQYVLHRIIRVGESYCCIGDNQFIYEDGLGFDQMIGVVTSFSRNGRDFSVDNVFYRLYCRLWQVTRADRHLFVRVVGRLKRIICVCHSEER